MKNLEQIRAKHALHFWDPNFPNAQAGRERLMDVAGENGGDVVRGLGSLIINNGILATVAFAKEKQRGYQTLMEEVGRFLGSTGSDGRNLLPKSVATLDDVLSILTNGDSLLLQQATAEALVYLGYLKRFRIK